jgi:hypothetical protein
MISSKFIWFRISSSNRVSPGELIFEFGNLAVDKCIIDSDRYLSGDPLSSVKRKGRRSALILGRTSLFTTSTLGGPKRRQALAAKVSSRSTPNSSPSNRRTPRRSSTLQSFTPGRAVTGFIGIDAGSTSTKAAVLDKNGEILSKNYQLSNGNPIQDTIEAFEKASSADRIQGRASLQVLRIRVETIDYFLGRYREDIVKRGNTERDIEAQLSVFERSLRGQADSRPDIAMAGN